MPREIQNVNKVPSEKAKIPKNTKQLFNYCGNKKKKIYVEVFFLMSANRNQKKAARWLYSLKMTQT